jgi:hypothetical protein
MGHGPFWHIFSAKKLVADAFARPTATAVAGVVVGVVVLVGGSSTSASSIFDCSNNAVGCRYTGTQSLGFQDPATFLIANCNDTNFEIPTSDNCDCEVNVPTSTPSQIPVVGAQEQRESSRVSILFESKFIAIF